MAKASEKSKQKLEIPVIRGNVLGVTVLRGYAKLSDLARISKPDIYDQKNNPAGTQRDLSPKHARAAYEYVKTHELAFWPEVFLCARENKVMQYKPGKQNQNIGRLLIDLDIATGPNTIAISRVDGNHRLHYADGSDPDFLPIDKPVSFCLAYDLTLEQEIVLFKDINDNQKAMNTSHLDNIEIRLTPEETLKRMNPDLYIAQRMAHDTKSPFYDRVYEGGKKIPGSDVPLRTLHTGINYLLARSTQLPPLRNADAQYKVIRNYFRAVKKWQPYGWSDPRQYLVLRGAGLWAVCFIGAVVIDRVLLQGKFSIEEMYKILKSGRNWDWSNAGDFRGYSGRGGALEISNIVSAEFHDESRASSKDLFKRIMEEE